MDSHSPRLTNYAGADGAVGTVFLIFGALGMMASLLLSYLVRGLVEGFTGGSGPRMSLGPNGLIQEPSSSPLAFLPQLGVVFVFSLFALMAAAGIGIRLSRGWGFSLGIVLCGLMMPAGSGWAVFAVAGAVFCVFRKIY